MLLEGLVLGYDKGLYLLESESLFLVGLLLILWIVALYEWSGRIGLHKIILGQDHY